MKLKLKLVVASMSAISVLGLISSPVLAATKHKHHKKIHRHHHHQDVVAQPAHEYKDMGALAPVVEAPRVDTIQMMYDAMSQNLGRSRAMPDWFNRIGISGGANADFHWGNRARGYMGENYQRVSVNDIYINATATINDWTKAFASLSYSNTTVTNGIGGRYSSAYTNNQVNIEQVYVTLANYDVSPVFFQVGKQFTDFGRYTIHPLTRTMTQVLSESLQTSAKLGFITRMGLHGDIYAFDNPMRRATMGHTQAVYGAALGFDQINDQLGYDVGIGYMSNMTGVNDVAASLAGVTYIHAVSAMALYGDVNSGPFNIGARYTAALQRFNQNDLSTQVGNPLANGAKPWAADITAGYGFTAMNKNQNVYLGYQTSNNAVNIALPKNRWMAGYNVDMWKYTNVGVELAHDTAYSSGNGGSGKSSNTIGVRGAVKFG